MLQTARRFTLPKNPVQTPRDAPLEKVVGAPRFEGARDGAHIVLGGDGARFVPYIEAKKWGGEGWLKVWHPDVDRIGPGDSQQLRRVGDRIEEVEVSVTREGRIHRFSQDAYKWEIVYLTLDALPKDGIERFYLDFPPGITWHYQPPLTAEDIKSGISRPENTVASYAGYYNKMGRYLRGGEELVNYATGKFAHIYRKEIIAADGARLWLDQEIVGKELQVKLPPLAWFLAHPGPWVLDPTVGYTTKGSANYTLSWGVYTFIKIQDQVAGQGTITDYNAWLYFNDSTTTYMGIYRVVLEGSDYVGYRVGCGAKNVYAQSQYVLHTFYPSVDGTLDPNETEYHLAIYHNDSLSAYRAVACDYIGSIQRGTTTITAPTPTYPEMPAQISPIIIDTYEYILSMYATYELPVPVGNTTDLQWRTAALASRVTDFRWATRQVVANQRDLRWEVRRLAGGVSTQRWNTRQLVANSLDALWHVFGIVSQTGDLRWAVTIPVGISMSLNWATRELVAGVNDVRWTVRAHVAAVLDAGWHVMETVGVGREYLWKVATLVAKQVTLDWKTRTLAGKELSANWNTLALIADAVSLEWHTLSVVGDELRLVWKWKYASRFPARSVVVIPRRVLYSLRVPRRDKATLVILPEVSSKKEN